MDQRSSCVVMVVRGGGRRLLLLGGGPWTFISCPSGLSSQTLNRTTMQEPALHRPDRIRKKGSLMGESRESGAFGGKTRRGQHLIELYVWSLIFPVETALLE